MRSPLNSAAWAAAIAAFSAVFALATSVRPISSHVPEWLGFLALPALPGAFLALFFDLGSGGHGIPVATDIAPHVLRFLVWWGILHTVFAWWRRRQALARYITSPLH
jgi:hypothetical protein